MASESLCFSEICLSPLNFSGESLFGFSEYLAGMALIILAWSLTDERYKFRISTAPLNLYYITFWVFFFVGVSTLLTDLWISEKWYVVKGGVISTTQWQALNGLLIMFALFTWSWFAFIRPPRFGKFNCGRYRSYLYRMVLQGSEHGLAVAVSEFSRSAENVIKYSTDVENVTDSGKDTRNENRSIVEKSANAIIKLIADRRFCAQVVKTSPETAYEFFKAMRDQGRYKLEDGLFYETIFFEALKNKDSFLYHEIDEYENGFLGLEKTISSLMFSNFDMIEKNVDVLNPDPLVAYRWGTNELEAYCRVSLMVVDAWAETRKGYLTNCVNAIFICLSSLSENLRGAVFNSSGTNRNDIDRVIYYVDFITQCCEIMNKYNEGEFYEDLSSSPLYRGSDIYDKLADLAYCIILNLTFSTYDGRFMSWHVCHNLVWTKFFGKRYIQGESGEKFRDKLTKRICYEIEGMSQFPNYEGAKMIGSCLYMMGCSPRVNYKLTDDFDLHKSVVKWVESNYLWLMSFDKEIAQACMLGNVFFDEDYMRIVKVYQNDGVRGEEHRDYLNLLPTDDQFDLFGSEKS